MFRSNWRQLAILCALHVAGCATPRSPSPPTPATIAPGRPAAAEMVASSQPAPRPVATTAAPAAPCVELDPRGYLERVALPNCDRLTDYTTRLIRYERRGLLFRTLEGPETIQAWVRSKPFSVRLCWLDPDIKYGEAVYIDGVAGNELRFVPRKWHPPLLPGINRVNVMTPVIWGETLNPITDFGLRRLAERLREKLAAAGDAVRVAYRGRVSLPEFDRPVHHLELDFPANSAFPQPHQDLYIDVDRALPVGIALKTAHDRALHAAYYYTRVDTGVRLTDDDFRLYFERGEPLPASPELGK
jgi:hypothetical protein